MMSRRWILTVVAALAALGSSAGGVRSQHQSNRGDLTEEFHQTYQLAPGGRVSLDNINGDVRVRGWDRPEVKVDAVKYAFTRERLEEAKIRVDVSQNAVRIETDYPHQSTTWTTDLNGRRNNPATVEYTLTIPRGARVDKVDLINGALDIEGLTGEVEASSINGRVAARALTGVVKLSTINGRLDATFDRIDEQNPVSLGSINGPVNLTLHSDANVEVRASTVHGSITNEFSLPVRKGKYVGRSMAGQFGRGGARVKLDNVNGPIHLSRASDGRQLNSVTNLLSETTRDEGEWDDVDREIERGVQDAQREAQREAREALREAARERREALREAERERIEAQRESEREKTEASREKLESKREAERERQEALREAEQDRQEALREAEQERRESLREAEEGRKEVERAAAEVAREASRMARDISRDVARDVGRAVGNDYDQRKIERVSNSLPASGAPRIRVVNFDGPVTVQAWDKPEVMYTAVKRAHNDREMQGIKITTNARNNTTVNSDQGQRRTTAADSEVTISAAFDKAYSHTVERRGDNISSFSSDASVELEVYVPRNSTLSVSSSDGRLRIEGVRGDLDLRTGDGSIDVSEVRGNVKANTGDGRIRIVDVKGDVSAETGDGRIFLEGDFSNLAARTGDGSISLSIPDGSNVTIETNAETVVSDGMAVEEASSNSTRRMRRWKVGNGGRVFALRTGDGQIILRRR